jgi:hypothetical protein
MNRSGVLYTQVWRNSAWHDCGDGGATVVGLTTRDAQEAWDAYIADWHIDSDRSDVGYRLVVEADGEIVDSVSIQIDEDGDAFAIPQYGPARWLNGTAEDQ